MTIHETSLDEAFPEVVVAPATGLDPDEMMLYGVEEEGPTYTVSQVAETFFARSSHWIRLQERNGKVTLDGRPVADRKTPQGARIYRLADIELLAHALAEHHVISAMQLALALQAVQSVAGVWGLLPSQRAKPEVPVEPMGAPE
jgi:hypothetical protein